MAYESRQSLDIFLRTEEVSFVLVLGITNGQFYKIDVMHVLTYNVLLILSRVRINLILIQLIDHWTS
jgi:hypothetical protein